MEVKISDFSIEVKDLLPYEEDGKIVQYITDSEIKEEDFQGFLQFYKQYKKKDKYFSTTLNARGFYGRFGQLIYSKGNGIYQMRLTFVPSHDDVTPSVPGLVSLDHSYKNLRNKVVKQEIILNNLLGLLEEKGIFNSDDLQNVILVDEDIFAEKIIQMHSEVDDLHKYLRESQDTMADIRKTLE